MLADLVYRKSKFSVFTDIKFLEYAGFCLSHVKSVSCYYLVKVADGLKVGMSVKAFRVPVVLFLCNLH